MEWISVKTKLPNAGQDVLWFTRRAFGKHHTYIFGIVSNETEHVEYGIHLHYVLDTDILVCDNETNEQLGLCEYATHWMPLPEPPKPN
jgi:hypothetical protein